MWPKFIREWFEMARREDIHVHVYQHSDPLLAELAKEFRDFKREVIAMHAETKQLVVELNDASNVAAAKMDKLIADAAGGLTKDQAVEHAAELTKLRDFMRAMGADPSNPIPPVE